MPEARKRLPWVAVYALAMALLEAVVVVYLRGMLRVTTENVSLGALFSIEVWREVATLVMLIAVAWLAGRHGLERLAFGMFAFGLWDVGYYVFLRVLIDWPASLLDWDILFLIPLRWWGPVLSPLLIAALLCVSGAMALVRMEQGSRLDITPGRVISVFGGGLLALYVFMADALHALLGGQPNWAMLRPGPFNWPLFLVALALMALPSLAATWPHGWCRATGLGAKGGFVMMILDRRQK